MQSELFEFARVDSVTNLLPGDGCVNYFPGIFDPNRSASLFDIKSELEKVAKWRFNSCLLNPYHDGNEAMGWHSDDEKELDLAAPIASLSLGGARKFSFKHKINKTTTPLTLEPGSVLVMHAPTQAFWHHSLLKTKQPVPARINLTFRSIRQDLSTQPRQET